MPIIITLPGDHRVDNPIIPGHNRWRPSSGGGSIFPWASTGRVSTAADEAQFVEDLRSLADGEPGGHQRSDVTALLNALRGGLTVEELLVHAPGLRPERLLSAHESVARLRRDSSEAWEQIVACPDTMTFAACAERAALLLPVPVGHLARVVRTSPTIIRAEIVRRAAGVDRAGAAVRQLERRLDDGSLDDAQRREVAAHLFNQRERCAWAHDDYLPQRVGDLVPTRVASLLGEHRATEVEAGAA